MRMKKLILFIFGLVGIAAISPSTDAAEYTPLVKEGMRWTYHVEIVGRTYEGTGYEVPLYDDVLFYNLEFEGDSIVDGRVYKKLYRSGGEPIYQYDASGKRLVGLMREDEQGVYRRPITDYEYPDVRLAHELYYRDFDQRVYNFTASEDEAMVEPMFPDDTRYLRQTKELQLLDGSKRNIYTVASEDNKSTVEILEGAGPVTMFGGNFLFPVAVHSGASDQEYWYFKHTLYQMYNEDGEMIYESPDKEDLLVCHMHYPINVAKVGVDNQKEYSVTDRVLAGEGNGKIFDTAGMLLYSGKLDGYRFGASGLFIVVPEQSDALKLYVK